MKKTWMALLLAAALALPLAGCGGNKTGSDMTAPSPSAMPDLGVGDDDLAGADGVVGGSGGNNGMDTDRTPGAGNTGNENVPGQADDSPLEDLGEGIRDTLDDMGSAARQMGRDAQRAMER